MTARKYIDNAPTTTVSGAINSSVTSFSVASLAGFPATFPYSVTLGLGTASAEQILVTGAVGTTVTVTRNSNGQGAFSHPTGETFDHTAVALDYQEANAHVNASTGVHGATGAVVGTTDSQTLTNKTLTAPTVNDPSLNKSGQPITLPAGPETLVGRASTDTLTNKTLTSPAINGGVLDAASTLGGVSGTVLATMPRGRMTSGSRTSNLALVLNTEAMVGSISDLSFTVVSGRRYKFTVAVEFTNSAANSIIGVNVRDGGGSAPTTSSTVLVGSSVTASNGTPVLNNNRATLVWELLGGTDISAGLHHVGVSMISTVAASTLLGSATTPAQFIIEDIGV